MNIDEQVIMLFFRGECTEAERKQVAAYLKAHKEIFDGIFDEQDWLNSLETAPGDAIPYEEDALLQNIQAKLHRKQRGLVKYMQPLLKWSAAACLVVLAIGAFIYYRHAPAKNGGAAPIVGSTNMPYGNDSVIWKNNSNASESRYLSDGSLVYLEPGSVLRYKQDFEPGKRPLLLDGEAKFIVAKNKMRPFVVASRHVSTTAIGTIFTVNSQYKNNRITVKLQEGKVLVQNKKYPADSLFLLPGEYCAFDGKALHKTDSLYYVINKPAPDKKYYFIDSTCELDAAHVDFRNTRLPAVFRALNRLYKINIVYKDLPDSVLTKTLYTGSFKKAKMKAADVVRMVSLINDLNYKQVDAVTYLINSK